MFAEKSWGTFTVIDNQENSKTIKIEMKPNMEMSYHHIPIEVRYGILFLVLE